MAFMHGYMKYTQPLFIQAIMALKGIYESKVSSQYEFATLTGAGLARSLTRTWLACRLLKSTFLASLPSMISRGLSLLHLVS